MHKELDKYRALYNAVAKSAEEMEKHIGAAGAAKSNLNEQMIELRKQMLAALEHASKEQDDFIRRKIDALQTLKQTRDRLHSELNNLKETL